VTETGVAELRRLEREIEAHEREVAAGLSEQERRTLIDLLKRLGRS